MDKEQTSEAVMRYAVYLKENKPGVKKIYLFGSHAKGTSHEDSDIDMAIIFESLSDVFDTQVELLKLRRQFDIRIEPHPFIESNFNLSHPLAKEILNNGVEIV